MVQAKVTITHETGLHARPAAQFVQLANQFQSAISVEAAGKRASAKSILGVLSLGANQGTEILITAEGPDEQAAVKALVGLVQSNFAEA